MTDDIWLVIHTERRALAADLASVAPEQWQTPSMCQGWTVHQVLAHMVTVAATSPAGFVRKLATEPPRD